MQACVWVFLFFENVRCNINAIGSAFGKEREKKEEKKTVEMVESETEDEHGMPTQAMCNVHESYWKKEWRE